MVDGVTPRLLPVMLCSLATARLAEGNVLWPVMKSTWPSMAVGSDRESVLTMVSPLGP